MIRMLKNMQLLSVDDAAAHLGLKAGTVRLWARQRKIASVRLGSRRMIPAAELIRLVRENLTPAQTDPRGRRVEGR